MKQWLPLNKRFEISFYQDCRSDTPDHQVSIWHCLAAQENQNICIICAYNCLIELALCNPLSTFIAYLCISFSLDHSAWSFKNTRQVVFEALLDSCVFCRKLIFLDRSGHLSSNSGDMWDHPAFSAACLLWMSLSNHQKLLLGFCTSLSRSLGTTPGIYFSVITNILSESFALFDWWRNIRESNREVG